MKRIPLILLACALFQDNPVTAQLHANLEGPTRAPKIRTQPSPQSLAANQPLLLRTEVEGDLPLRFQWFCNGSPIIGATNQEYAVYKSGPSDDGVYRLNASNSTGSVQSEDIRIQVHAIQPELVFLPNVSMGQSGFPVVIQPLVTGTSPFTFTWLRYGTNFSGSPVLPLPQLGPSESGEYQLIVRNAIGAVTSQVFSITFEPYQAPLQLALERTEDEVQLNFSFGPNRGLLAIYGADHFDALANTGFPIWEQTVNGSGNGNLRILGLSANTSQFFRAVIHGSTTNPATEIWSTVPAGQFIMGSSATEAGHVADEGSMVPIEIRQVFFLARREVTQAEFLEIMGFNPSAATGNPNLPVEQVTWEDATNYCVLLTRKEKQAGRLPPGYEFRLPTEAEWEYASRAGSSNRFSFGDDPELNELKSYAWYSDNSGNTTHPVGTKLPNAWGLYDMHGNVAEWCTDFYGSLPERSMTDPTGPRYGEKRVIRGGSFSDEGKYCRSATRFADWSTNAITNVGFRVALAPLRAPASRTGPALVWINSGEFLMGSPHSELDRQEDESPRTQVSLSQGFFMGRYEITQAEYEAVMGSNPSRNLSYDNLPVDNVTWYDALQFCRKLTELERAAGRLPAGHFYRLPTEAEWEYAVRAGSTNRLFFGHESDYAELESYGWLLSGETTHQVGAKLPNPWGLYDIYGNVWEWCMDDYIDYAGGHAVDPVATQGETKVMRGGSSFEAAEFCRSACRMNGQPEVGYQDVGFRVVLAREALPVEVNPEMIWVPAGSYRMGSPLTEKDRETDEGPMAVTISHGFWMGRHEVSQAEYSALMGTNTSYYQGWAQRPADQVSWDEAVEFCSRLTAQHQQSLPEGYVFRLPTEAEWEYAARAGTSTRFSYGDDLEETQISEFANCLVGPTGGVGGKKPNPWGFYDMHGNVSEWCLDGYAEYSGGLATDPWARLSTNQLAVCRGGSITDAAKYCRSAFRSFGARSDRHNSLGFRVALARQDLAPIFESVRMIPIPAGQFLMGSSEVEEDYEFDEGPETVVTITSNYWMSAFEITQAQYHSLMRTNPSWNSGYGNLPVEQVSWNEANEFCHKLTEHEAKAGRLPVGFVYRLPTEAEWEYATRAGSTNRFNFGDDPDFALLPNYAWCKYVSDGRPHGVGIKLPNRWGLYDIYGNVAEWCLDGYGPYPGGQVIDPISNLDAEYHVIRGGSYFDTGLFCRSAFRLYDWTADRFCNVGFRVVLATQRAP